MPVNAGSVRVRGINSIAVILPLQFRQQGLDDVDRQVQPGGQLRGGGRLVDHHQHRFKGGACTAGESCQFGPRVLNGFAASGPLHWLDHGRSLQLFRGTAPRHIPR